MIVLIADDRIKRGATTTLGNWILVQFVEA